jgi:hypothetical protein
VKRKWQVHRPLSDYTGATVVKCPNEDLNSGDPCPECIGKGRLYDLNEPTALLQFRSEPLINATIYRREVLRCSSCQHRYEAPLPPGVKYETYDPACDATIALMKYGFGLLELAGALVLLKRLTLSASPLRRAIASGLSGNDKDNFERRVGQVLSLTGQVDTPERGEALTLLCGDRCDAGGGAFAISLVTLLSLSPLAIHLASETILKDF